MSMASISDSVHQMDPSKKTIVDDASSSENSSSQQPSIDKKEDDLIPMPEDEEVKEVITPKQVASKLE